jgi:four helix bundle protein
MANYKNLDVWRFSMQLVKDIYFLTKVYPKDELFGLLSQTKRAAVSIPSNIAEGLGRQYKKDTLQFLHIARGSVYELDTHLEIALMVEIINTVQFQLISNALETVLKLLNGLINSYEKRTDLK